MKNVKIIYIEKEDDLEKIKALWMSIQNGREMTFFQSFSWNKCLTKQYFNNSYNKVMGCKLAVLYTDKILVPLVIQKRSCQISFLGRKKGIYILGYDSYSDYLNFVYDDISDFEIELFIDEIKRCYKGYSIYLNRISHDSQLEAVMLKHKSVIIQEDVSVGVIINTHKDYTKEDYNCKLSKSTRQNLRTSVNRINKDGKNYELSVIKGIVDQKVIEELIPIHLSRVLEINTDNTNIIKTWVSEIKKKRLRYEELNNNVIRYAMSSISDSILVLVKIDKKIAGYLYGFCEKNTIRIVQNCVVSDYKFYSPMFRGAYDFICNCIDNKIEYVDFTRGAEVYKYKLGGEEQVLTSFVI